MDPGSLAMLCSGCPHIGINIDPDWQEQAENKRFVDALFHTINGNFPQNQKRKKFNLDNFPVTMGALYFANEEDIRKFMAGLPPYKAEHSTCHKFGVMEFAGHWGEVLIYKKASAVWTKEMTSVHHHDVINNYHNDMNICRTHTMAHFLSGKYKEVVNMHENAVHTVTKLEEEI
ncbi:hypothetical protein EW026_g6788 [Hermanssonia centrifuga]|uniref:Uncharacterized protein n=1 Tax=Hermanssonia centrifuga TaxID=98765 RepID=A0A4S4K9X4_9APHY|nr:hypothetical protein EW026_g6788 [Hermanssonia centrifuga]